MVGHFCRWCRDLASRSNDVGHCATTDRYLPGHHRSDWRWRNGGGITHDARSDGDGRGAATRGDINGAHPSRPATLECDQL